MIEGSGSSRRTLPHINQGESPQSPARYRLHSCADSLVGALSYTSPDNGAPPHRSITAPAPSPRGTIVDVLSSDRAANGEFVLINDAEGWTINYSDSTSIRR